MEAIVLVCALPFFLSSLGVIFGRRHDQDAASHPDHGAAAGSPHATEAPPPRGGHLRLGPAWVGKVASVLLVVFVVAVFLLLPLSHVTENALRLVVLCRYSIVTALTLTGLVPLALHTAPTLLGNGFVLRRHEQLFHVTWMTVLTAAMALVTCRVTEVNSVDRYQTQELFAPLSRTSAAVLHYLAAIAALLVLALPIPLACIRATKEAMLTSKPWEPKQWIRAACRGAGLGLLVLLAAAFLQFVFIRADPRAKADDPKAPLAWAPLIPLQPVAQGVWWLAGEPKWSTFHGIGDLLARALDRTGPMDPENGYTVRREGDDSAPPRLAPGHALAMAAMLVVFLLYFGHYFHVKARGIRAMHDISIPPLYVLLLLVVILGYFLQGAAFALDRYWIPASIAVLLYAFAIYQLWRFDHVFSLGKTEASGGVKAAEQKSVENVPGFNQVAASWKLHPTAGVGDAGAADASAPKRTLVIVTASGGGIQAAAWTARVLTGLYELYGTQLTDSIKMISAVSGGSVGAMYCLNAWPPTGAEWRYGGALPDEKSVCGRAMTSSLEATAWGLAFPDLLRVLAPIPFLVSDSDDRGARIEEAWRGLLKGADGGAEPQAWRMNDLIGPVSEGGMPIPVFNATIVETGQRFLASPVLGGQPDVAIADSARARQLYELYPEATPLVSTMVRLSATFPFVSPICRPELPRGSSVRDAEHAYHFADGGYVDNEGMVTVIEWLTAHLEDLEKTEETRTFDRILLLRLMPFPATGAARADLDRGWFYATLGPLDAITTVRTASQQERNDLAVHLFTRMAAKRWNLKVASAKLQVPDPNAAEVDPVVAVTKRGTDASGVAGTATRQAKRSVLEPPLSWNLTDSQKAAIQDAWQRLSARTDRNAPLKPIDAWFTRGGHPVASPVAPVEQPV